MKIELTMTELLLIVDMIKNGTEKDNEGSDSYVASDLEEWEPKKGELIQVRDWDYQEWLTREFVRKVGREEMVICLGPNGHLTKWNLYKRLDK